MRITELLPKKPPPFLVTVAACGSLCGALLFRAFRGIDAGGVEREYAWAIFLAAAMVSLLTIAGSITLMKIAKIQKTQGWIIDATRWNIERLKAHGLCRLPDETAYANDAPTSGANLLVERWPWGGHHTELLGHLEAAARKFWTLYAPDDPSTAPTNEMVSDWLHSERRVSKDKAKAIASILRPDGLPTGPRR